VGFVANGALAGALSLAGVALCLTLVREGEGGEANLQLAAD
jgi:hypothetical protein